MDKEPFVVVKVVFDRRAYRSQKDYELQNAEARSHAAKQSATTQEYEVKSRLIKGVRKYRAVCGSRNSSESEGPETDPSHLPPIHYLDPLFNIPHPKLSSYSQAMDIWFQWMVPNASPSYIIFNIADPLPSFVASPACQSEAAQHCIAAAAYISIDLHRRQTTTEHRNYHEELLKHNGLAISKLKDEVVSTRAVTDIASTVNAIVLLGFLAYFRGDPDAGAVHRSALESLSTSFVSPSERTEWDRKYGSLMLHMSAWIDVFEDRPNALGIVTDQQKWTLLTSVFYQPGPGNGYEVKADLPIGFQRLVSRGLLSHRTRVVLTRFSYACRHGLNAVPQSDRPFPDFVTAAPCLTEPEPSLEKCLVLALFCYTRRRWTSQQYHVAGMICHTIARTKLAQMLPVVSAWLGYSDGAAVECLIWIWMVLIYAYCLEGSDLGKEGQSYLGEFKLYFPDWRTWVKIESDVLPKFFWRDEDSIVIRQAWHS